MNLTESSMRRPVTTLMLFVCFVVIGLISSKLLPLEYFPDLDSPYLSVEIPYSGSTPEEVEREITRPAEEVLATMSGYKRMTSNSRENGANIQFEFDWGENIDLKAMEAKEKLDGIRSQLPPEVERIFVHRWSTTDMEMMTLRVSSNRDLSNAYEMLDRNLKRKIERLDGVAKVDLYGVQKKEIRIELIADRIISHQVDLNRLVQTLRRANFSVAAGKILDGTNRYVVRPIGEFKTVDEIGDLIVGDRNIRLSDIAQINYGSPELHYGRHLNQRYAVGLNIYKEAGANVVEVCRRIVQEIDGIGQNPEMAGISIYYMDNQGDGIISSINELLKSGLLGGFLAILVLYFFLRQLATTLIVALAVPFSLLITLAIQYFFGLSLNILSMMGLMLAVGMLVDNAVVATESIHRHQKLNPKDPKRATIVGVKEISMAISAGTLTTAIVFLPNIVNPNDEVSIYLKHVALTICISLGASLIIAQTVVPLLASRMKPPSSNSGSKLIDKMVDRYGRILRWTLDHPRWSFLIIVLLIGTTAIPLSFMKLDMFDGPDDRRLRLHYNVNGNYKLEKVERIVDVYEEYLFDHQDEFEIESVYTYYETNFAESTLLLKKGKDARKSMSQIQDEIRANLPIAAIANPSFERGSMGGRNESIRVQLIGKSTQMLTELSHEIAWTLSRIPGLQDVRSEAEVGEQEVQVKVNPDRARRYGFTTQTVANSISAAMRGINLRTFRSSEGEIDVRLQFQPDDKQTLENLRELPLMNDQNRPMKLAMLADFEVRRGPRTIRRTNRTTTMGVNANLDGVTVSEARERIQNVLNEYRFPAGYTWNYGQRFDDEEQAFNAMVINLLLALALIYFVMAALFESLIFPAAIWTQIIFAIIGVFWFFALTNTTMSVMGMIGILILIGVVVNNGIVLIDHINRLRSTGLSRRNAILEGGKERLRPILMTAGTTVLSLVPLCVVTTQIGGNGPPYFPMARAIVGGLAFSTVITLVILPTIYSMLDDLRIWTRAVVLRAKGS